MRVSRPDARSAPCACDQTCEPRNVKGTLVSLSKTRFLLEKLEFTYFINYDVKNVHRKKISKNCKSFICSYVSRQHLLLRMKQNMYDFHHLISRQTIISLHIKL